MSVLELYLELTNSFIDEISKEINPNKMKDIQEDLIEENPLIFDKDVFDSRGKLVSSVILDRNENDEYLLRTLRYYNKRLIKLYGEEIMPLRAYEKYNKCLEEVKKKTEKDDLWKLLSFLPKDTALDDRIDKSLGKDLSKKFRQKTRQFLDGKERYKLLFEFIGQPVFVLDLQLNLVEMNTASSELFEKENYKILGHDICEMGLFEKGEGEKFYKNIKTIIEGDQESVTETYNIKAGEERDKKILEITTTGLDSEGETLLIVNVCRDITTQISLEENLRESLEEKEEMEEKKEFLNTLIRQDLRSRVQTIQGYLQLLEEADLTEEYERYLIDALRAGEQAYEIIDMAKKLKKMEKDHINIENKVSEVIDEAVEDISKLSEREGVEIVKDYPSNLGKVKWDHTLRTFFSNILKMRIHVSECENIEISAEESEEKILFEFSDDGDKLPEEIKKLFEGQGYTGRTTGASGAKYYMLKQIAEHNDASIRVKDSELGGTRFHLEIQKQKED